MRRFLFLLLVLVESGMAQTICAGIPTKRAQETNLDWISDVRALRRELPRLHKNLFHDMTRGQFEAHLLKLARAARSRKESDFMVALMELTAEIGDAHTGIDHAPGKFRFQIVPFKPYIYSDGVYVQVAAPELKEILGARLVSIDGMPIDQVLKRVMRVVEASNESSRKDFAPFRLNRPALLRRLGIANADDHADYEFERDGRRFVKTLHVLPRKPDGSPETAGLSVGMGALPGSGWLDASPNPPPLWLSRQQDYFWSTYLDDGTTYLQCNAVADQDGMKLAEFFRSAIDQAEQKRSPKFILDLRLNGGGDNTLLLPVIHRLIQSNWVNQTGRLYVIIGRRTQSAAQNFVNLLEIHTHAMFVGEPTGEWPNHYGEPADLKLPATGIVLHVSTLWWQDVDPRDARKSTVPSLPAAVTSVQYSGGRDPALEVILKK